MTMSMPGPYRFVTLSPQQIEERRNILDRNGFYAYLTPIVILTVVALYQKVARPSSRSSKDGLKASPPTPLRKIIRQAHWWLSTPLNPEFGAVRVHLMGILYATWLLFLSFRQTTDDYMHLTKRLGHIAISQLPLHYLLAVKSPSSPIQSITGLSYETLLPYHRLSGRLVHLFLLAHGILYMNFFWQAGLLPKRLSGWDVRFGITALTMLNILGITAIPPIRKVAYHNHFYKSHVCISLAVLLVPFLPVPYTRLYVVQCFLLAAFNAVTRASSTSKPTLASVTSAAEDTTLIRLSIPGPASPSWVPGQHCYVKQDLSPMMPRSPFTIVSSTSSDEQYGRDDLGSVELIFRNLQGPMTSWLANKPSETGKEVHNVKVFVEGPYGEAAEYVPQLFEKDNGDVLLVAGGVGATFTLPIYIGLMRELVRRKTGTAGHTPLTRDRKIVFVWVARAKKEIAWGIEMMKKAGLASFREKHGIKLDIRVYITNRDSDSTVSSARTTPQTPKDWVARVTAVAPSVATTKSPVLGDAMLDNEKAKFPVAISTTELTEKQVTEINELPGLKVVEEQRPNLNVLVEEVFGCTAVPSAPEEYRYEKVTVLTCGPRSLGADLRREVGRHVMGYGREVDFREEVFGHGGA